MDLWVEKVGHFGRRPDGGLGLGGSPEPINLVCGRLKQSERPERRTGVSVHLAS